jgi:hypothetical protein
MPKYTNEEWMDMITPTEFVAPQELLPKEEKKTISLTDTIKAAFKTHNVIGSYATYGLPDRFADPSSTYDPYSKLIEMGRTDILEGAQWVDNEDELHSYIKRRDDQKKQHQILDESGWLGVGASMAAGVIDPLLFVPGGGVLKGATKLQSVAKSAIFTAAGGAGITGAQEALLAASQEDLGITDIGYAALAGGVFGGLLGGAAGGLTKNSNALINETIKSVLKTGDTPKLHLEGGLIGDSVGATKVSDADILADVLAEGKQIGLANINETFAKNVNSVFGDWSRSPKVIGITSPYTTMRKTTRALFDTSEFITGTDKLGIARGTTVEDLIKVDMGRIVEATNDVKGLYYEYLGIKGVGKEARAAFKGLRKDTMSFDQFQDQIDLALRNNDVHEIPAIAKAAQRMRKDLDEVANELKSLKLLPEDLDVKGAESWFRRSYNIKTIRENRLEFKNILTTHYISQGTDSAKAAMAADDTIRNILGAGDKSIMMSQLGMSSLTGSGKLGKERVLDIPDNLIRKFLDTKAVDNYSSYMAQAKAVTNLNKVLQENGWDNISDIIKELRDEVELRVRVTEKAIKDGTVPEAKGNKAINREWDNFNKNEKRINDWVELTLGRSGGVRTPVDKLLKEVRKYQTMRLLGNMGISAIPDAGSTVFRWGLPSVVKHGIMPMVRDLKISKAAKNEFKHFNVGLELSNNEILNIMSNGTPEVLGGKSRISRFMDGAVNNFGKLTLNTYWTNFWKRLGSQVSSAKIFEAAEAFSKGKVDAKVMTRMAQLGLGKDDMPKIWEQFQKYGKKHNGSYISSLADWDNTELMERFGRAVMKDVDSTIITPGRGDIPLVFQNSQIGKTMFQFKSFTSAAANKILLSGLQRRDANVLMGWVVMVGLGSLSYAIRQALAGKDISDIDEGRLLAEGIARSGVGSLMSDMTFALNPYTQSARYAGLNTQSYIFGPSANMIGDTYSALQPLITGKELKDTDKSKIARLLPYHNLFWLRKAMEEIKEN